MNPVTREDMLEAVKKRCNINFHDRFDILGALADECNDRITQAREEKIGQEIEYKVIDSQNVGVPLSDKYDYTKEYSKSLELGLGEQFGKDGWLLCSIVKGTMFIFARRKSTLEEPEQKEHSE